MANSQELLVPGLTLGIVKVALRKHLRAGLFIFGASLLISVLYTSFQVSLYQARASVLIEDRPKIIIGTLTAGEWMSEDAAKSQRQLAESSPVLRLAAELAGPEKNKKGLEETLGYLSGGKAVIQGQLLYLSVIHPEPKRVAELANKWAEAFAVQMTERQQFTSKYTSVFLDKDILKQRQEEWYQKQDLLAKFQFESKYDFKENAKNPVRERYESLSAKLADVRMRLDRLRDETKAWADAQADPLTLTQTPRARQDLKLAASDKLIEEQNLKLIRMRQIYLPSSENLKNEERVLQEFVARRREALETLGAQIRADLRATEDEARELEAFLKETDAEFQAVRSKGAEYQRLYSDVDRTRLHYEELAKRQREAEVEGKVGISYARVWEEAGVPGAPYRPSWPRNLAMGLMLGLVLGAGAIYLAETLDDTVRSQQQLSERMGLNVMGSLPLMERIAEQQNPYFLAHDFPRAAPVESLRTLRSSLDVAYGQNASKEKHGFLLVITSCGEREGKSFLASNLATLFAMSEKRVLLVDMDLHKATLTKALDMAGLPGLTALSEGERSLYDCIHPTRIKGLSFLPCGRAVDRPAAIIESVPFAKFLKDSWLLGYDVILVDTPPVLAVADASHVVSKGDATLVVVRSRVTHKGQVEEVTKILQRAQAKECIYILNGIDRADAEASGYRYYGYGETRYSYAPRAEKHESIKVEPGAPPISPSPTYAEPL